MLTPVLGNRYPVGVQFNSTSDQVSDHPGRQTELFSSRTFGGNRSLRAKVTWVGLMSQCALKSALGLFVYARTLVLMGVCSDGLELALTGCGS